MKALDCESVTTSGYARGKPMDIAVVRVDGVPVERQTANAYWAMRQAAAAEGVMLRIRSGFRTHEAQEWLYACYTTCSCNSCTKAAKPGYSRHESGHALDLDLSQPQVHAWLSANAGAFGFRETVRGEPWHWEWDGRVRSPGLCR